MEIKSIKVDADLEAKGEKKKRFSPVQALGGRMRLGCLSNWSGVGPGQMGIRDFLETNKKIGFKYLEVSPEIAGPYLEVDEKKAKAIKTIIEDYGIVSLAYCIGGWEEKDKELLEKGFETAVSLGVEVIVGCAARKVINDIDKLCNQYKVYFAIENHWHHPDYESPQDVLRTLKETSHYIGANIDTGHFASAGYNPIEAAELLKGRINHVHLKDVKAKDGHDMCVLGEGVSKIDEFIEKMKEINYQRMLSVEFIKPPEPIIENLIKCREFCEKLLEE